jgi:F0F1-type ATP synthase assembly protein I
MAGVESPSATIPRHVPARRLVTTPPDDRSPTAKAYQWATRIMVVSLEMVLPGLLGYWLDRQLGTVLVFMIIGLALGCTGGLWHLIRLTRAEIISPDRKINREKASGEKRSIPSEKR